MAATMYLSAVDHFINGDMAWDSGTFKAILINTTSGDPAGTFYTFSAAHDALDDVPENSRIATSGALTTVACAGGVLDADDIAISGVTSVYTIEAVIVYCDDGATEAGKWLVAYLDGLNLTPNGGQVTVQWHANGICAIS